MNDKNLNACGIYIFGGGSQNVLKRINVHV